MIPSIREARRRSRSTTPTSLPGFCKREVREILSLNVGHVIVSRSADAAECWENAAHKHRTDDPADIPRGAPTFWLGGSAGHGHATEATGAGGHWTMDLIRSGFFDRTGIALVSRKWTSLRLVGWTEDYDGVDVMRKVDGVWRPIVVDRSSRVPFAELAIPAGFDALGEVPEVQGEVFS